MRLTRHASRPPDLNQPAPTKCGAVHVCWLRTVRFARGTVRRAFFRATFLAICRICTVRVYLCRAVGAVGVVPAVARLCWWRKVQQRPARIGLERLFAAGEPEAAAW